MGFVRALPLRGFIRGDAPYGGCGHAVPVPESSLPAGAGCGGGQNAIPLNGIRKGSTLAGIHKGRSPYGGCGHAVPVPESSLPAGEGWGGGQKVTP